MSRNRNERDRDNNNRGWNVPALIGGVVGGLAAVAGGLYLYSRSTRNQEEAAQSHSTDRAPGGSTGARNTGARNTNGSVSRRQESEANMSDTLSDFMRRLNTSGSVSPRRAIPMPARPVTNLNGLIDDIYVRYIALNDTDFEEYYGVMHKIFLELHNKMKEVDQYYKKYSSKVQYAGSHPDNLRINKPDEFDIDIVISLPLSYEPHPLDPSQSDFIFEPKDPGFIQLKMGVQYDRLPYRDGSEWSINRTAYTWKDEKNYLLRSKFMDWFKSVVNRALNQFPTKRTANGTVPIFRLDGTEYTIRKSESGPAMTLYVENVDKNFKLDVDLVPALKFPIGRWPVCSGYQLVPPRCRERTDWMVVPKPNKAGFTEHDRNRSWRLALHEQEAMLMHNTNHMRQAIRLIKKLRDSQGMNKIASYYIKTLFFWEAMEQSPEFWNQNPVDIFKFMLKKFHEALIVGKIPYFWNKNNNLIGQVDKSTLDRYVTIVGELLEILKCPFEYKKVAKYLLTQDEYKEYEKFLNN